MTRTLSARPIRWKLRPALASLTGLGAAICWSMTRVPSPAGAGLAVGVLIVSGVADRLGVDVGLTVALTVAVASGVWLRLGVPLGVTLGLKLGVAVLLTVAV